MTDEPTPRSPDETPGDDQPTRGSFKDLLDRLGEMDLEAAPEELLQLLARMRPQLESEYSWILDHCSDLDFSKRPATLATNPLPGTSGRPREELIGDPDHDHLLLAQWIHYFFGRDVDFYDDDEDFDLPFQLSKADGLRLLTWALERHSEWAPQCPVDRIGRGLWWLADCNCGAGAFRSLVQDYTSHPIEERVRALDAIAAFMIEFAGEHCQGTGYGHQTGSLRRLESAVYMFWDLVWYFGQPHNAAQSEFDAAALRTMQRILMSSENPLVREHAIHGLGHWQDNYPAEVRAILEEFLGNRPELDNALKAYAQNALIGHVQ